MFVTQQSWEMVHLLVLEFDAKTTITQRSGDQQYIFILAVVVVTLYLPTH